MHRPCYRCYNNCVHIPQDTIKQFQNEILQWYRENKRDLPWRKTRDPYTILVSEVMSQQTQISRALPKYEAWLVSFPTIYDLAQASVALVLKHWSGLGYNRRALNLKKTAEIIVSKYHGEFPQNEKELRLLPGIGVYTARALLCFAFNQQIAVVDTNVRKVILTQIITELGIMNRELGVKKNNKIVDHNSYFLMQDSNRASQLTDKELLTIAEALIPKGKAYEWNQALMDYASTMLKKEKIPIPKQSKFRGSHRYYRGQILKLLVSEQTIAINELGGRIMNNYSKNNKEWLQKLIEELQTEGFITITENTIQLTS